ncbi:MAG TPA: helix-turn-helix domain-containing protein [Gaiellaceae bacterium]|nr:helix-turn-helix domain-containing protein [Gaiellaceae bacterium]
MTPKQARAALLLGRGLSCRAVAQELRISERTITRYRAVPGFTEAERRAHNERVGEETGLRGVLDQALYAVKRDGSPDFQIRLKAAALLLNAPPDEGDPNTPVIVRERIYDQAIEAVQA